MYYFFKDFFFKIIRLKPQKTYALIFDGQIELGIELIFFPLAGTNSVVF